MRDVGLTYPRTSCPFEADLVQLQLSKNFPLLKGRRAKHFMLSYNNSILSSFFFLPRIDFTLSSKKQRCFVINMFTAGYNGSNTSNSKCRSVKATTLYVLLEILVWKQEIELIFWMQSNEICAKKRRWDKGKTCSRFLIMWETQHWQTETGTLREENDNIFKLYVKQIRHKIPCLARYCHVFSSYLTYLCKT